MLGASALLGRAQGAQLPLCLAWKQQQQRQACRRGLPRHGAAVYHNSRAAAPAVPLCPTWKRAGPCASSSGGAVEISTYQWSWSDAPDGASPSEATAFDAAHPIPLTLTAEAALQLFEAAAASDTKRSPGWLRALSDASEPHLVALPPSGLVHLLSALEALNHTPSPSWLSAGLQAAAGHAQHLTTAQLASLMWSLSNLSCNMSPALLEPLLGAAQAQLQEFYSPDLARFVCAVSSLMEEVPAELAAALLAECEYQLVSFPGDFTAFDLARLTTGLAGLPQAPSEKLRSALTKAVYVRTRTMEEKGAVDFALARLDANSAKSMHFDPRWTHEELKWLPRRERDKRRILKDGWYRTRWGGWRPG